ncbi:MAG: acetate--CoA ligase [Myxococcales bacterium]|nr:acetate--CoA ligase [Myxococcales bacterium]
MSETYEVPEQVRRGAAGPVRTREEYLDTYHQAQNDPSGYWLQCAKHHLSWRTPPTLGLQGSYHTIAEAPLRWFADGRLNVTESCLDRHLATRGDKVAILWEGDEPGNVRKLTYRELHAEVCRAANALAALGVGVGDRVIIYMGMVPEAAVAMLACARVGAVHSVVFGGFSADSLRDRIIDCGASVVITQDEGRRGGRSIPLKATTDEACDGQSVRAVLVYRHTGTPVQMVEGRDVWWQDVVPSAAATHTAVEVGAEDPLFILYTSGSTGKPKGLVHTSGGYLLWATWTCATTFDLREDDVFACVADIGWITGHSYIVYGPLANGATTLMFESTPLHPDAGRYWDMVQRHRITVFYTAPTAIRALAAHGTEPVQRYDRSSLRVLGTVGEPINPDAWRWYHQVVGEGRCNVVDTWWQTETGGHMITPIAPVTATKPGSATLPLPGVLPKLLDDKDREIVGPGEGRLCIRHPWPGQARTVWGDHERYVQTYFGTFPGLYFTGDGARRDEHGYFWITGRVDDVINVAGHRMGTAEFESALVSTELVAEAAVVPFPHDVKGQGVMAYVVLRGEAPAGLADQLNGVCRTAIGAHARIDRLAVIPGLPKTRSGKVMRRILRKVAEGRSDQLGDVSTLADPSVVQAIIAAAGS